MKRFTTGCGVVSPGVAAPTPRLFSAAILASRRPSPRSRFSRYSAATAAIVSSSAPRARSRCTAVWPTVISYPRTCSAVLSACFRSSSRMPNRSSCSYSAEAVRFAYRRLLAMVCSFLSYRVFRCPRFRSGPLAGGVVLSSSRFSLSLVRNRSSVDFRSACRRSGPSWRAGSGVSDSVSWSAAGDGDPVVPVARACSVVLSGFALVGVDVLPALSLVKSAFLF